MSHELSIIAATAVKKIILFMTSVYLCCYNKSKICANKTDQTRVMTLHIENGEPQRAKNRYLCKLILIRN